MPNWLRSGPVFAWAMRHDHPLFRSRSYREALGVQSADHQVSRPEAAGQQSPGIGSGLRAGLR
jgi:hypothetical protein